MISVSLQTAPVERNNTQANPHNPEWTYGFFYYIVPNLDEKTDVRNAHKILTVTSDDSNCLGEKVLMHGQKLG